MGIRKFLGIAMVIGLILGIALGAASRPRLSMAATRPWQSAVPGARFPLRNGEAAGQQYDMSLPSEWHYPTASDFRSSSYMITTRSAFADQPGGHELARAWRRSDEADHGEAQ